MELVDTSDEGLMNVSKLYLMISCHGNTYTYILSSLVDLGIGLRWYIGIDRQLREMVLA